MSSSGDEVPSLCSNIEVLHILQKRLKNPKKSVGAKKKFQHRDWVEFEVAKYLKSTPCSKLDGKRYPVLKKLLQSRKKQVYAVDSQKSTGFGLTEAEAIQVLNLMPTELVEIHLMIEDLQSRMPEKQQNELLEAVASYRVEDAVDQMEEDDAEAMQLKSEPPTNSEEGYIGAADEDTVADKSARDLITARDAKPTAIVKQEDF
ncbi:hypothetical protein ACA910_012860 [Epithemia clementina (nom. ined.)]